MKIKKGDKVQIRKGKDRGREGTVEKVLAKSGKAVISGLNIYKTHVKPKKGKKGGIVEVAKPLPLANVTLVCSKCQKVGRVGFKIREGKKVRICKKCEGEL